MKKKLGNPLPPVSKVQPPTDIELDEINALWDGNCPPFFVGLLDAQLISTPNGTSRFIYDPKKLQYRLRKTGKVILSSAIKAAFLAWNESISSQ